MTNPRRLSPSELADITSRAMPARRSGDDPRRYHLPQSHVDRILLLRHIAALEQAAKPSPSTNSDTQEHT